MCRQSPVKPEGILIQILSQIFWRDRSLMCTGQPPFDQRNDEMNMGQQLGSFFFASRNIPHDMVIFFFLQRGVTKPPVGNNNAVGPDVFLYERDQTVGGRVRDYPESYPAKFFFLNFNGYDHQGFRFGFSSFGIRLRAAYKGFVHLNSALKPIPTGTNHCVPKLTQPDPGGFVPAESHGMLQILRACSGLLRHHPPHNVEPQAKRFTRSMKNCSGGDRGLMPALGTDQKRTSGLPELIATAARTYKTSGPTQTENIIATILFCSESCYELFKIFRIIFKYHNLPSISQCMIGILHVVSTGGKRIPSLNNYARILNYLYSFCA